MTTHAPQLSAAVRTETFGDVAVVTLDDGRANALSYDSLDALDAALDAATGADALVINGRPGKFCAGFDLSVVQQGPKASADLMNRGGRTALRLFTWPRPVVLGVTGHAIAMGAVLLCCGDLRIGAEGDFKIGLNEVAIGLSLPPFAIDIAGERLATRHLTEALALARIYSPAEAVEVGYLDLTVPAEHVADTALERAADLASRLDSPAFARTRRNMRGPLAEKIEATFP